MKPELNFFEGVRHVNCSCSLFSLDQNAAGITLWSMALSHCPFDVPTDPASLHGPPFDRPEGIPEWDRSNVTRLHGKQHHGHGYLFSPQYTGFKSWTDSIRASQFPHDCKRYLLVEDDMQKSGLGFTAKLLGSALLLAMRDSRVLLEVRAVRQAANGTNEAVLPPRWCDRPPFTLQCIYMPWTHCSVPPPAVLEQAVRPRGRPLNPKAWPHDAPVVRVPLGRIHRQIRLWAGAHSHAESAAVRFLFRLRPWAASIAKCAMRHASLSRGDFVSVHIRHSREKERESASFGVKLPPLGAYDTASDLLAADVGTRHIFLQTASPLALANFSFHAVRQALTLSYTDNPRSEHDSWGGWQAGGEMAQATVAAVNAQVGSQAAAFLSPTNSIWTYFISMLMSSDDIASAGMVGAGSGRNIGGTLDRYQLCCPPATCQRLSSGHEMVTILLNTRWVPRPPAALLRDCRGHMHAAL